MAKAKPAKAAKAKPAKRAPAATSVPDSRADALLAQILAAPDDRAPRLIYADLLIEAGDPRGTFIAHQCGLVELDPLDERYAPMLASTRRLEATHAARWLARYLEQVELGPYSGGKAFDATANAQFEAGFLRRIAMPPEEIARAWPRLREHEPIRGIELIVGEHLDAAFRTLREPRDFEELKVSPASWFTANSVANVLAWGMPKLRSLDLSGCDLGTAGARLLANLDTDLGTHFDDYIAPPPFAHGQLHELVLANGQIGDEGARALFGAPHLEGLAALDLTRCRLAEEATLTTLRGAPAMQHLQRLALTGNNEVAPALAALAGWDALPRLTSLALPQATPPDALAALFPRPSSTLRRLALASAKLLGPSPVLLDVAAALTHLDIGTTSLGDDRWRALVAAPCARRLLHLESNGCSLSDAAVDALVASPLDRLVTLDLSSNKLTDRALHALAGWPGLQHVAELRLGNNRKLTAAGFTALAAAPHLQPAVLDIGKQSDLALVAQLRERFGAALTAR